MRQGVESEGRDFQRGTSCKHQVRRLQEALAYGTRASQKGWGALFGIGLTVNSLSRSSTSAQFPAALALSFHSANNSFAIPAPTISVNTIQFFSFSAVRSKMSLLKPHSSD